MPELGSSGSGAARLAAIPAGASPANTRSPVHVVVISSGSEGDQTAGSLEVKALWGRGDLVRSVFVVEGEKDADRLASLGLVATCNAGGAGKWCRDFARYFEGVHV